MANQKEFSDTKEDIQRASEASGAKKMLEDLAKKMRGNSPSIDWSHPKPSICDELIAIVTAAGNTGTKTYKKMSCETVGGYELYITTLKRDPIYHHGSDYTIECTEPFRIKGTMTTALRDTRVIEKLKGLHCNILEIHNHDSLSIKSSHIHFKCENMSVEQIKDIMRFLRYY